ncbi:MAG: thioesterase [Prevotellaceae bacterium]|nr:thioesterase [Prevotella sp.]MDD7529716.1 thioesterase [Prevotellaceae bacterium]MDY2633854.1 thioesterase [Prevotella sp.]
MEIKEKIGRYNFLAEPFHCDFTGSLTMGHLGNNLINAADFHSHDRGFGVRTLQEEHKTWVLSRLTLEMNMMPVAYADFHVDTWVEGIMRFFTRRNFKIEDNNTHQVYGYGRSIWAMIDTRDRKPTNLLEVKDGKLALYVDADYPCPIEKTSKIKTRQELQIIANHEVVYSDLDLNGHFNSIKYIERILDIFPPVTFQKQFLKRMEIAYVNEAYAGETLHFSTSQADSYTHVVRIDKLSPIDGKNVEVCRCILHFIDR